MNRLGWESDFIGLGLLLVAGLTGLWLFWLSRRPQRAWTGHWGRSPVESVQTHGQTHALDVDYEEIRSLHRVVRAMHDGECPRCHTLHNEVSMRVAQPRDHRCPSCGFEIKAYEVEAVMRAFAPVMEKNLMVFLGWRDKQFQARKVVPE
jgi:hypothetical protein